MQDSPKKFMPDDEFVKEYFPEVDPQFEPYGGRVLVQYKLVRKTSHGGILLTQETADVNRENTVLARVVRLGPIAYCNRETGQPWTEGRWARVGDVVLVPRWGGFRFPRLLPDGENQVLFSMFPDFEVIGCPTGGYDELDQII